jgi:enamine deaminase RidA (YjgF/YER057c/UK114 family)
MSERERKFESLGYSLDYKAKAGGLVEAVVIDGPMIYASGQVPMKDDVLVSKGKVPGEVSFEDAKAAAALCAANCLRAVQHAIGSLDRIERVVRITGYVNSDPTYTDQHLVINGASQLVRDIFGEAGRHARTALGMAQLPLGASTEIEMILRLKSD